MSKLINPDDYIKVSSYTKKYGVYKKKLYRYIENNSIDYIMMDGIPFLLDEQFDSLKIDKKNKSVTKLTKTEESVKKLTSLNSNYTDNQEVKSVKKLTNDNVTKLTLEKRLKELNEISIDDQTIKILDEIDEITKELNKL